MSSQRECDRTIKTPPGPALGQRVPDFEANRAPPIHNTLVSVTNGRADIAAESRRGTLHPRLRYSSQDSGEITERWLKTPFSPFALRQIIIINTLRGLPGAAGKRLGQLVSWNELRRGEAARGAEGDILLRCHNQNNAAG